MSFFQRAVLLRLMPKKTGKEIQNVKALSTEANNSENARKVFEDFGNTLGDFIAPYLGEFGAEVLVLGGNISKAFEFFGSALQNQIQSLDKIYVSQFGEEAAIIGSALLLDETYYAEIEETLKLM